MTVVLYIWPAGSTSQSAGQIKRSKSQVKVRGDDMKFTGGKTLMRDKGTVS